MMKQEIEIEFKNLLTSTEFHKLMDAFHIDNSQFKEQTNYYFDTPTFDIKENRAALRIRYKNDCYVLTLKQPSKVGLLETHETLTKEEATRLLKGESPLPSSMEKQIKTLGIEVRKVNLFGSLTTKRAEVPYKDGLLVLDHSTYLNHEDFELEYEVRNEESGKKAFLELLNHFHIPMRETNNKIQRFFNLKHKQLGEHDE